MKNFLRSGCLAFLLLFTGCDNLLVKPDLVTMQIADHQVDCTGLFRQKCMLVKMNEEPNWTYFYGGIEGFTFEEGYECQLIVRREEIKDPPQDASSIRYVLVKIVEKTKT